MTNVSKTRGLAILALVGALGATAVAQFNGGNGRENPRQGGNVARTDAVDAHQRLSETFRDQLGLSDDEIKLVLPNIDRVLLLRSELTLGHAPAMPHGMRPGEPGAPAVTTSAYPGASAVATKTKELAALLEDKDSRPEEIRNKLDDLRAAKSRAKDELVLAQADLRELLSQRQEAVLVIMGILE